MVLPIGSTIGKTPRITRSRQSGEISTVLPIGSTIGKSQGIARSQQSGVSVLVLPIEGVLCQQVVLSDAHTGRRMRLEILV